MGYFEPTLYNGMLQTAILPQMFAPIVNIDAGDFDTLLKSKVL